MKALLIIIMAPADVRLIFFFDLLNGKQGSPKKETRQETPHKTTEIIVKAFKVSMMPLLVYLVDDSLTQFKFPLYPPYPLTQLSHKPL